jgi:hypothetical protein
MIENIRIYLNFIFIFFLILNIFPDLSHAKKISGFYVDDFFPSQLVKVLEEDINQFLEFPIERAKSEGLRRATQTKTLNSETLMNWLNQWVHFLVYQRSFSYSERFYIKSKMPSDLFEIQTLRSQLLSSLGTVELFNLNTHGSSHLSFFKPYFEYRHIALMKDNERERLNYTPKLKISNLDFFDTYAEGILNFNKFLGQIGAVDFPPSPLSSKGTRESINQSSEAPGNNEELDSENKTESSMKHNTDSSITDPIDSSGINLTHVTPQGEHSDDFLMINLGAHQYSKTGLSSNSVVGAYFVHNFKLTKVDLTSPAIGFIEATEHLFLKDSYPHADGEIDSLALSFFRLSTLFHEAAHSRGHGSHSGFPHTLCPSGMREHSGKMHCDLSANGGNGIKALFLGAIVSTCKNMQQEPDSEQEILRKKYPMCFDQNSLNFLRKNAKDAYSRVINRSEFLPDFYDLITLEQD